MSTPQSRYEARSGAFPAAERTVGELLADLTNETGTLIRQEVKLAGVELADKAAVAGRQVGFIATGALLGAIGLLLLLQSLVIGLAAYMEMWVSALVVGLAVSATAAALTSKGLATLRSTNLAPRQTIQSIEANKSILEGQSK
jgi:Putative Actinobacterial Holin-X, holin superfamily III